MLNVRLRARVAALMAAGFGMMVMGEATAASSRPLIASARVSADGTALVVTGMHLMIVPAGTEAPDGAAPPRVSLALTPLPVTAATAASATATLPSMVEAGTHLVVLTRSDGEMAVFYLTTGAVGPRGKAGVAGPAGSPGRKGVPGLSGPAGPQGAPFTATDAAANTRMGLDALRTLTRGRFNTAFGRSALRSNTIGSFNTAVGRSVMRNSARVGFYTTAIGHAAFANVAFGADHTGFGSGAGRASTTGLNNVYIGHFGLATESELIRIGTPGTHTQTYLSGTVNAPAFVGDGSALTNVPAVYR